MRIKIAGLGDYPMPDKFTYREMNVIKKMTGLRAGEVYPALAAGDSDVIAAFALTAIRRESIEFTEDNILDLELTDIELVVEDSDMNGGDGGPPAEAGVDSGSDETPPS